MILLREKVMTHTEIGNSLKKSPATISVCLSELFENNIIEKTYDIPSNKYSLKNPTLIRGVLNVYYPDMSSRLTNNTVELLDF